VVLPSTILSWWESRKLLILSALSVKSLNNRYFVK